MRGTGRASPLLGGEVFGRRAQVAWFGFYDQRSKGCGPLEASWPLGLVPLLSEKTHFRVKQLEWGLAQAIGEHLGLGARHSNDVHKCTGTKVAASHGGVSMLLKR